MRTYVNKMKKIIFIGVFLTGLLCFSQSDRRFGVMAGINEYYMDNNFLFSKSGIGFNIGFVGTFPISEYSEILAEMSIARHNVSMQGREDYTSEPEWIDFRSERAIISVIYDYDLIHFLDEDLVIGLNLGPSVSFTYNFAPVDDSKKFYYLDPYYAQGDYMGIDSYNESLSLNAFVAGGVSIRYRDLEANIRYFKGITDPYRNVPLTSSYVDFKGKDNYATFTLTYYLGRHF